MKRLPKALVCAVLSLFVVFLSVGYAAVSETLYIGGSAESDPPKALFITSVYESAATGGASSGNVFSAFPTNVSSGVTLPSQSSTLTLTVKVKNNTSEKYDFVGMKYADSAYSNPNIVISLKNLKTGEEMKHGDMLFPGEELSFEATFSYKSGYTPSSSESLASFVNYEFKPSSSLEPIYIRDVEVVSGSGTFDSASIGTNKLNAIFSSTDTTVYKITMANRSHNHYGYYATIITNASDSTNIDYVSYKLFRDEALSDSMQRRDLLQAASDSTHGTRVIYLVATGTSDSGNVDLHTVFDIRFQTPIEEIPAPGTDDGEVAVENALDKFKIILSTPSELTELEKLLDTIPTSGSGWGSTSLRNDTYVAYVPSAPESDKTAALELFDGQLEINIENEKKTVYFLIKREDVTGDGKEDYTVYMTTNTLGEEESSVVSNKKGNFFSGYYYTTYEPVQAVVYAAVFTQATGDDWIQLGDMFKGDAPVCNYDGGMVNYRPSGASTNTSVPTGYGSFNTDFWKTASEYYSEPSGASLPTVLAVKANDLTKLKEYIDAASVITSSDDYAVIYTKESRDVLDLALLNANTAYANATDTSDTNDPTQAWIVSYSEELRKAVLGLRDSV